MKTADKEKLWDAYRQKKTQETREQLIIEYAQLVKLVAGRLSMYLGHNVEYDDLVSYGIFGLIDAIDKFDLEKNVKFETYASLRIRGAILDQIRKMDWIPRSLRQKQKKMEAAISKIETQYGRPAKDEEIASELGIETEELISWQGQAKITNIISLDEFVEAAGEKEVNAIKSNSYEQPESIALKNEIKQQLMDSLETLTDKERKVILLYYYEELTLKEISRILEVSESRVSQLHTKALQKMKVKLGDYMEILNL
jgi:RNA polymerase sigma factor for flagellar operon FliA